MNVTGNMMGLYQSDQIAQKTLMLNAQNREGLRNLDRYTHLLYPWPNPEEGYLRYFSEKSSRAICDDETRLNAKASPWRVRMSHPFLVPSYWWPAGGAWCAIRKPIFTVQEPKMGSPVCLGGRRSRRARNQEVEQAVSHNSLARHRGTLQWVRRIIEASHGHGTVHLCEFRETRRTQDLPCAYLR